MTDSNTAEWKFFSVEQRWFYSAEVIEVFVKVGDRLEHDTLLARVETATGKTIDLFNDTPRTGVVVQVYWERGDVIEAFDPHTQRELSVLRYWYNEPVADSNHPLMADVDSNVALLLIEAPELVDEQATITWQMDEGWCQKGDVLFRFVCRGIERELSAECDGFFRRSVLKGGDIKALQRLGYIMMGWKPKGYQR